MNSLAAAIFAAIALYTVCTARVEAPRGYYRPAAAVPMEAFLQVPLGECQEIQKLRKRMDKIRGKA